MTSADRISREMKKNYAEAWAAGDPWDHKSPKEQKYEEAKFDRQLKLLGRRRYRRVLEIGCGNGRFTRRLAGIADKVVALDIAAPAVKRARVNTAEAGPGTVEFRVANVMEYDLRAEGPWDLVVFIETVYCLGWLYPMFDVAYLAGEVYAATAAGGRLLLTNTFGRGEHMWLLLPHLIHTYRDLFRNVGYHLKAEDSLPLGRSSSRGVLISLLQKPARAARRARRLRR
jgi:SAM-dependent methyltransferase